MPILGSSSNSLSGKSTSLFPFLAALGLAGALATGATAEPLRAGALPAPAPTRLGAGVGGNRRLVIHYRAHDGRRTRAIVVLPRWYDPKADPPLPLIISPHGRGVDGASNAKLWGSLPGVGGFVLVSPDGHGRVLPKMSWGYRGQIDDLARMPGVVTRALPWLRIDRERIYAFGSSMGGQETLLLAALHPRLLAGAAAFDSVADLALRYRQLLHMRISCDASCRRQWGGDLGPAVQALMRDEVGRSPAANPLGYRRRSPLAYARRLARSGLPLQLWWSRADEIVTNQGTQSGRLLRVIRKHRACAPVTAFVGSWQHSHDFRAETRLPLALAAFGLLPYSVQRSHQLAYSPPPPSCAATTSAP